MKTRRTCKRFCTLPAPDELLVPLNFPPNEDCVLEAVLFIKFLEESCVEMFAKISANLKNGDDRTWMIGAAKKTKTNAKT